MLVSDQSLDAVLARHRAVQGQKPKAMKPVRRADGRVGIVDLMLSQPGGAVTDANTSWWNSRAPKVKVGQKEVAQLKTYAQAVVADPQFHDAEVTWDLWSCPRRWTT